MTPARINVLLNVRLDFVVNEKSPLTQVWVMSSTFFTFIHTKHSSASRAYPGAANYILYNCLTFPYENEIPPTKIENFPDEIFFWVRPCPIKYVKRKCTQVLILVLFDFYPYHMLSILSRVVVIFFLPFDRDLAIFKFFYRCIGYRFFIFDLRSFRFMNSCHTGWGWKTGLQQSQ